MNIINRIQDSSYLTGIGMGLGLGIFANTLVTIAPSLLPKPSDEQQAIFNTCFWEAAVQKSNGALTVFQAKAMRCISSLAIAPITEEIVFRLLLQDVILKRIPKVAFQAIAPGSEKIFDTNPAKVIRIAIAAGLFASVHEHKLLAFSAACVYGAIKESPLGLLGSIGAHTGRNLTSVASILFRC